MLFLALAFGALQVAAHMHLNFPPTFNGSNNPFTVGTPDPYLDFPYDCCGPNDRWVYPCRGYLSLLGTAEGSPTASWEAGSTQNWSMSGLGVTAAPAGTHYGGSCQVGFSIDQGKTFRVATSYEGNCPHRNNGIAPEGQTFEMTVPSDLPSGEVVFAMIWYNREQEFNMGCSAVSITTPAGGSAPPLAAPAANGGASSSSAVVSTAVTSISPTAVLDTPHVYTTSNGCTCTCESPVNITSCNCTCPPPSSTLSVDATTSVPAVSARGMPGPRLHHAHLHHRANAPAASSSYVPFNERPEMLVADNGNGCLTPHSTAEVKYPNPGPEVVLGDGVYPLELPSGSCDSPGTQAYDGSSGNDGHP